MVISTDRMFKIWAYRISHGQLLLRSGRSAEHGTRIDLLFKDVSLLCLPSVLHGLTVEDMGPDSTLPVEGFVLQPGQHVFRLTTKAFVGYVAASVAFVHEDQGDYFETSSLIQDPYDARRTASE